ncbi:MAG: GtrA family protein [Spirochaetes bacterium]|nr:GtrA family protein [Spirochaetota bacterium]
MGAAEHKILPQLARSAAVSLLAFAIDFAILVTLTEAAGLHYLISAGISFLVGTTVSYVLSVTWVFPVRRFSSKAVEYLLFIAVGVIGLGLNEVLLWVFTEPLGIFYMASKVIAAALIFFWNFGARKFLLFPAYSRPPRRPAREGRRRHRSRSALRQATPSRRGMP